MTLRVAASNSSEAEKEQADFRCDGISDNIEIQAAIDWSSKILVRKFQKATWILELSKYLSSKYKNIESRLLQVFNCVALDKENGNTFSFEFASILKDAGGAFGSTLDELVTKTSAVPKDRYDFADYRKFLVNQIPDIHTRVVAVSMLFPLIIAPFSTLTDSKRGQPKWWLAYNAVKHSEVNQQKQGNLSNTLGAVAALAIVGSQLGVFVRTDLFVNIGVSYPPSDPAIRKDRILFEMD